MMGTTNGTTPGANPAPASLVADDGSVNFGVYDTPFRRVDLDDAQWTTKWGWGVPRPLRRARLKQWQHFALIHPEALLTCAIVDAGYMRLSWTQFVDLKSGERVEHHHQSPMADLRIAEALWDDRCHFRAKGYEFYIRNHLDGGKHTLRFDIGTAKGLPVIAGEVRALHAVPNGPGDTEGTQPLVVALPLGSGRGMYSHKVVVPLEGELQVGDRLLRFDPERCHAIIDVHKAHYPHHTWWRWATFAGKDSAGRRVAVNLTRNVVVGEALNENAVWCDGRLERLGKAVFESGGGGSSRWRVSTDDGRVDLTFEPLGARTENLRLGLVRSQFEQFYGRYSGRLRFGDKDLRVEEACGLLEDHDSKW